MASDPDMQSTRGFAPTDVCAVIVAAGQGLRMKTAVPKQFLPLAGRPVLAHSIDAFSACPDIDRIVLVVAPEEAAFCRTKVLPAAGCRKPLSLVRGGAQRADSVFNGIKAAGSGSGIVVIHDGVRPLVRPDQISAVVSGARETGACILAVPVFDTLKNVSDDGLVRRTVDRTGLWAAQTPQAFRFDLIFDAHIDAKRSGASVTDDALLLERRSVPVQVVRGDAFNLKITTAGDIELAEALLAVPGLDGRRGFSDSQTP